jgi:hypothetical protein
MEETDTDMSAPRREIIILIGTLLPGRMLPS